MTDLPEFNVSVKMARKTGPLHSDVEYRTFTVRGPARNAKHAEAIAFGLGHGINEASGCAWKFCGGSDGVTVAPAGDEQTELDKLRAELAEVRNQAHRDATDHQQDIRDRYEQIARLERHIAGLETQCNEQMHALTAERDGCPVCKTEKPAVTA